MKIKKVNQIQGGFFQKNFKFGLKYIKENRNFIYIVTGIFFFFVLVGYLLFQYRFAFINPPLSLEFPAEKSVVSSSAVNVSGVTDPNATVYVQNEAVFLNPDGSFAKKIDVFPGEVIIEIRAVNRFGKETKIERHIQVKP